MKFVIGRALTILSWDDPVTAFFEKVEKLRHSLGRPSRSDFVQFQSVGEIESTRLFEFFCEKPVNRRMLICVACGNGSVDIESSHQKQGGIEYA